MNLNELYNEKKQNQQVTEKPVSKPKKIKKKDIIVEDIFTRELQYYEYNTVSDIKIYNGVLIDKREEMLNNIEFFKTISACDVFTSLHPSTLTARGEFSNMNFSEESFIKTLKVPPIKFANILKIGCNYGEIYNYPNPYHNHLIYDMVNSIKSLNNENIQIGCSCSPLVNTEQILEISIIIDNKADEFAKIFKKFIKDKIIFDKTYKQKKVTKILKNFTHIQNFIILTNDEIRELYTVVDQFVNQNDLLKFCNNYLDSIVKLITIFTDYEAKCKCCEKYTSDNLLIIDKSSLVKKIKNSSRGRKPKKKNSKRKIQGTGKYFSSQISFEMYNSFNKKITKIKIFRNGCYQIPGVKKSDMSDLIDCIQSLKDYFNYIRLDESEVKIPYIISVMRNYTCRIVNLDIIIILSKLEDIMYFEKSLKEYKSFNCLQFLGNLSKKIVHNVFKYCNTSLYQISEISLNGERYPGLLVKFLRSIPGKTNKKLTIKILSSGKINIDGATSELEVFEIYHWLQYIFLKYWDEITFDSGKQMEEIVSDDSDTGYLSIYD